MSELQSYYDNFACANVWADADPQKCGCHGSGWFLSEVDTWHKCPCHYKGQPHPEDYDGGETEDTPVQDGPVVEFPKDTPQDVPKSELDWEDDIPF